MGTAVEDLLRLARQAEREGRPGTRDALLTLAVAESLADEPALAERCRGLLTARQPNHWFATADTHAEALGRAGVVDALAKLRAMFPAVRVQRLLLRADALRGPYTGRRVSLTRILGGLTVPPPRARTPISRRDLDPHPHALPFPLASAPRPAGSVHEGEDIDPDGSLVALYWSVLMAMATLLHVVLQPAARDSRAA
jgi:hypothetical protein